MPGFIEANTGTYVASVALLAGRLVTINSSRQLAYTTASGNVHGVVLRDCNAGDPCQIRYLNCGGTIEAMINGGVAVGGTLYVGGTGYITTTVGIGEKIAIALEASTAVGDIIEVMPITNQV